MICTEGSSSSTVAFFHYKSRAKKCKRKLTGIVSLFIMRKGKEWRSQDERRADKGPGDADDAAVRGSDDSGQPAAAVLQCGGYPDCGAVFGSQRAGGGWFLFYADDLFDLDPAGTFDGQRTVFSIRFGQKDEERLREGVNASFVLIAAVTLVLNLLVFAGIDLIIRFPAGAGRGDRADAGISDGHLRGSCGDLSLQLLRLTARALGNSMVPLLFLALSAVLNILLDLCLCWGSARWAVRRGDGHCAVCRRIGIAAYTLIRFPGLWRGGKFRFGCPASGRSPAFRR